MAMFVEIARIPPSISNVRGILLELDAAQDENHELSAEVTTHKVEKGADVSDHISLNPYTLNITGIVTATPLDAESDPNREVEAWDILTGIMEAKEPVTVRTSLRTYNDMVLTSASVARDNMRRIAPPLTFQQIRRVSQEWTSLPAEVIKAPRVKASATDVADKGTQPPDKKDTPEEKKSILAKMADSFLG